MKENILFIIKTKITIKSHLTLVIQKNQMKIMTLLSKKMLMLTHMVQMKKNIYISIILNLLSVELVIMIQQNYFLNNISRKRKRKVKKRKIIISRGVEKGGPGGQDPPNFWTGGSNIYLDPPTFEI